MELGENADYLTEPPDSAGAMPPVTGSSLQLLPLARLSPPNLERLCLRLGERDGGVEYAGIYGVPGQAQAGIDVLIRLEGGHYRLFQSRRIQELTPAGVRDAVSDFLSGTWAGRASSFVYATSASAARTEVQDEIVIQTDRLAAENIEFDLWDDDRFSRKLKDHPDLVVDFFGPEVLRAFLPDQAAPALAHELVEQLSPQLDAVVRSAVQAATGRGSVPDAAEGLLDLVLVSGDLAPDIREILAGLRASSKTEAAHLASYVRDDPRRARDLIREPQPWVDRGSWQLQNALGLLAGAAGLFGDAEAAFLRAAERSPASERALLLIRAHEAAEYDDRSEDSARHFERARELDAELIAVRLVDIRRESEPETRLNALTELAPTTDRERNSVDLARIDALAELDRDDEALGFANAILERTPDSIFGLDRRAGLAFRIAARAGSPSLRDLVGQRQAVQDSLQLRDRMRARGRARDAGQLLARAAECLALLGESDESRKVLASATEAELKHRDVRLALAQATLHSGSPGDALGLLGEEAHWTDDEKLIAVQALALSDERDPRERAIELAEPLLKDPDRAGAAALGMVTAAAFATDLPWPSEAEEILGDVSPAAAAHFRAERLARDGKEDEAERLLQRHASEPAILRSLVERSLSAENWARGLALAERLVSDTGRGEDRLLLARALKGAGKSDRLKQELNALAADTAQSDALRGRAFAALSAEIPPTDYAALDELTNRWLRDLPEDVAAQWQRTYVLARLARYEQALALIDEHGLRAETLNHARLMASTFVRALKPLDAARRIAQLSDQFDRADEGLEALILFTATRTSEEADAGLRARLAETFQTFPERFPDSTAIRTFTVDEEDPESILEVIRSQFDPDRDRQLKEMVDQVAEGSAPLAYLSTMVSRHIPQMMQRIFQVPLAYGHPEEWDRELALARAAVGGPAVWDPTSLTIAASMPDQLRLAVTAGLPGSVLAYSSLQECDRAEGALDDRSEEESIAPEGDGFRLDVVGEADLNRERDIVRGAFALARELTSIADVDSDEPDELDEFLAAGEHPTTFDTFPATVSAARRRGLPIYSDDRYVRLMAHGARIETFGNLALLSALAERGDVDSGAVAEFRLGLLRRGAVGLRPTGEEIARLSNEHDDEPAGAWLAALLDTSAWRNDADEHLRQSVVFLRHIWLRRPEVLEIWVARVLDCARRVLPQSEEFFAQVALIYVWFVIEPHGDDRAQRAFVAALLDALERAPSKLGIRRFNNLPGGAIALALRSGGGSELARRRWIVVTIVRQLRYPLDANVLVALWNSL